MTHYSNSLTTLNFRKATISFLQRKISRFHRAHDFVLDNQDFSDNDASNYFIKNIWR